MALLLTALPQVLATQDTGLVNHAFAPAFHRQAGPSHPLVWLLLAAHVPALLLVRRAIAGGRQRVFDHAYRLQGLIQFCWLQLLAWFAVPWFPTLGLALMVTLMVCWAANDAVSRQSLPALRRQYLLAFPAFDGMLLALDLVGGPGLVTAAAADPGYVVHTLVLQVVLLALTQTVLSQIGQTARAQAAWQSRQEATDRKLAIMQAEKAVIAQSSVLLGHGLAASQFSHDVASPITVMRAASEELAWLLDEGPSQDPELVRALAILDPETRRRLGCLFSSWDASARQVLRDLDDATERTMRMTGALARSLSARHSQVPHHTEDLVDKAIEAMQAHMRGHDRAAPQVDVLVEPSSVQVTPGHVGILGNLLTNGALHAPGRRLEVHGEVIDDWYYRLVIRDHGVSPDDRPRALRAIRASLQLGGSALAPPPASTSPSGHRGYGIALMLAKVLVVKHHGWIAASAPPQGRGVALHLVLPRVEPELIPAAAGHPGRFLAGLAAHG